MKLLVFLSIFLLFGLVFAQDTLTNQENGAEKICIHYFYGIGCPHCARVDPFLDKFELEHPEIDLIRYEIYTNRSNIPLLQDFFNRYEVPQNKRGIPAVFVADKYLVGDTPIINNLEDVLEEVVGCQYNVTNATGQTGHTSGLEPEKVSIWLITGAALVDSINPCAMAVLLILLGFLIMTKDKKAALKSGLAFTISIYIAYFLFGLGIFAAIQISGFSFYFYKFVGILAIIIGLLNIKDFVWYGAGGFATKIPKSWRPHLKGILGRVATPLGAFLAGFVVCLIELPCTGGPYLYVLGLLAEKATQVIAVPILLYYNIVFILPLLIIISIVYRGLASVEQATQWKERNIKKLHLIAGIIMLILGIVVLIR